MGMVVTAESAQSVATRPLRVWAPVSHVAKETLQLHQGAFLQQIAKVYNSNQNKRKKE